MITIGIDPGASGAMAVFINGGWTVYDCPTVTLTKTKTRKTLTPKQIEKGMTKTYKSTSEVCDPAGMASFLRDHNYADMHLYMEKVGPMKDQGVTSMFGFGEGFGMWKGILAAFQIPYTLVTPQSWKKKMMQGLPKEKDASRLRAVQLFPELQDQLNLKKHDGRAEALLIGEFGRNHL